MFISIVCFSLSTQPPFDSKHAIISFLKQNQEFPLWLSSNELDKYPWGCGFDPWPRLSGLRMCIAVSCGINNRLGLDVSLLWLWCRPGAAAQIWSLAWELPYAMDGGPKKTKKKKKKDTSPDLNIHTGYCPSAFFPFKAISWEWGFYVLISLLLFCLFVCLWPHTQPMEVPGPGIESEPQLGQHRIL